MDETRTPSRWGWLVLVASSATLVCCALPIILVSIGLGAASAALFATFPFLVTVAEHKAWIFAVSGALLLASAWSLFRPDRTCPTDPKLAELCDKAHYFNTRMFWVSVGIWLLGFGAAYLALPVYRWLGP